VHFEHPPVLSFALGNELFFLDCLSFSFIVLDTFGLSLLMLISVRTSFLLFSFVVFILGAGEFS